MQFVTNYSCTVYYGTCKNTFVIIDTITIQFGIRLLGYDTGMNFGVVV